MQRDGEPPPGHLLEVWPSPGQMDGPSVTQGRGAVGRAGTFCEMTPPQEVASSRHRAAPKSLPSKEPVAKQPMLCGHVCSLGTTDRRHWRGWASVPPSRRPVTGSLQACSAAAWAARGLCDAGFGLGTGRLDSLSSLNAFHRCPALRVHRVCGAASLRPEGFVCGHWPGDHAGHTAQQAGPGRVRTAPASPTQ